MAGYSRLYVVGGLGGFQGADGVNPISFQILVGDADRQWLEAHYFDASIKPLGDVRIIVPAGPDHPDALLDASIAFFPQQFRACPSLVAVEAELRGVKRLDFDSGRGIPAASGALREEARPLFGELHIWRADLVPYTPPDGGGLA